MPSRAPPGYPEIFGKIHWTVEQTSLNYLNSQYVNRGCTEVQVQRLGFVCFTIEVGCPYTLCNILYKSCTSVQVPGLKNLNI